MQFFFSFLVIIVCVEHAKFWVFFEKLRNSHLQSYVNCLSHSVCWMCNFLRKIVYIEHAKDWEFFENLLTSNVHYYVIFLTRVYVECTNFFEKLCSLKAEFSALFEKLHNFHLENYVNFLSHSVIWMCNLFLKSSVHWMCKRLIIIRKIAYFERTLLCNFLE